MDKTFTLIIATLISLSALAQKYSLTHWELGSGNATSRQVDGQKQFREEGTKQKLDSIIATGLRKVVYTYNEKGLVKQYTGFEWKSDAWVNNFKYDRSYDDKGNNTAFVYAQWNGTQWVNDFRMDQMFAANGDMTQEFYSDWNDQVSAWAIKEKYDYTYNSDGTKKTRDYSYWLASNWVLSVKSKYEYTYDSEGNITQQLYSSLSSGPTSYWYYTDRTDYTYDTEGNNIEEVSYSYKDGNWEARYKYVYSYDNTYSVNDIISPFSSDRFYKHKLTKMNFYTYNKTEWVGGNEFNLYYSGLTTTGINDQLLASGNLIVYPNPVSDFVKFSKSGLLTLSDIQGNVALVKQVEENHSVSLDGLNAGMYFYQLNDKGQSYTGKLLVK